MDFPLCWLIHLLTLLPLTGGRAGWATTGQVLLPSQWWCFSHASCYWVHRCTGGYEGRLDTGYSLLSLHLITPPHNLPHTHTPSLRHAAVSSTLSSSGSTSTPSSPSRRNSRSSQKRLSRQQTAATMHRWPSLALTYKRNSRTRNSLW